MAEMTALGAAMLAGCAVGLWPSLEAIQWPTAVDTFRPVMGASRMCPTPPPPPPLVSSPVAHTLSACACPCHIQKTERAALVRGWDRAIQCALTATTS
jgi:glycerol kinase